jgi:hypothetical protein
MISVKEARKIADKSKAVQIQDIDVSAEIENIEKSIKRTAGKGRKSVQFLARSEDMAGKVIIELEKAGYTVRSQNTLIEIEW